MIKQCLRYFKRKAAFLIEKSRETVRITRDRKRAIGWFARELASEKGDIEICLAIMENDIHLAYQLAKTKKNLALRLVEGLVQAKCMAAISNPDGHRRYLLIKDWSCGFWADIDHIVGQLYLAELTHRIPIVYWGTTSLYSTGTEENCFENYFEPVSEYSIESLENHALTFYPEYFRESNLRTGVSGKFTRNGMKDKGFSIIDRPEAVLVSDRHIGIEELIDFFNEHTLSAPIDSECCARGLVEKYLRPRANILQIVDGYWKEMSKIGPLVAVHVRGGDRAENLQKLDDNNKEYFLKIDLLMEGKACQGIFLLTDTEYIIDQFRYRYGSLVMYTQCQRGKASEGIHYSEALNKRELGVETMVDVYLAKRCEHFLGCMSNVSKYIKIMKDWKGKAYLFPSMPSLIL